MHGHQAKQRLLLLLSAAAIGGCATGAGTGTMGARLGAPLLTYDNTILPRKNLIGFNEIAAVNATTAWEVVERLRPDLLRANPRGIRGLDDTYPEVFLNNGLAGGLDALQTIPAKVVLDIRWVDPINAHFMFGPGHQGGVIVVRTR